MSAALRFLGHFADERQRTIARSPAQPADCVFLAINGLADERQRTIMRSPAQPADYAPCSSTASPMNVRDRLMKIKNWISGWNALK